MSAEELRKAARQAEERADEVEFAEACRLARSGPASIQGPARDADTARRRAVVARLLRNEGWSAERVAKVLRRTRRAVEKMLRNFPGR